MFLFTTLFPSFYQFHLEYFSIYLEAEPKTCILRSAGFSEASWSGSTLFQNRIYQEFTIEKGLLIKAEK